MWNHSEELSPCFEGECSYGAECRGRGLTAYVRWERTLELGENSGIEYISLPMSWGVAEARDDAWEYVYVCLRVVQPPDLELSSNFKVVHYLADAS